MGRSICSRFNDESIVAQRVDRVEQGRSPSWIPAEKNAYCDRDAERQINRVDVQFRRGRFADHLGEDGNAKNDRQAEEDVD